MHWHKVKNNWHKVKNMEIKHKILAMIIIFVISLGKDILFKSVLGHCDWEIHLYSCGRPVGRRPIHGRPDSRPIHGRPIHGTFNLVLEQTFKHQFYCAYAIGFA